VDQVFQAMGLTMQQDDLDRILEEATVEGVFTMDSVLEEFRQWKIEQIDTENVKALFRMLAVDKYIHPTFPKNHKYSQVDDLASPPKSLKNKKGVSNLITETTILGIIEELAIVANKNEAVGMDDVYGFIVEIKHKLEKSGVLGINYEEF